VLKNKKSVVLG